MGFDIPDNGSTSMPNMFPIAISLAVKLYVFCSLINDMIIPKTSSFCGKVRVNSNSITRIRYTIINVQRYLLESEHKLHVLIWPLRIFNLWRQIHFFPCCFF